MSAITTGIAAGQSFRIVGQADTDEQLIELWLHGRSHHTIRAYRRAIELIVKPLHAVKLADLQMITAPTLYLAAIKSLLAFACRVGYTPFDVGRPLRLPKAKDELAQRIIAREKVRKIIELEPDVRNKAILHVLYFAGLRASELSDLKWKDLTDRGDRVQLTVFGKGGKTREILLAPWTTDRGDPESYIFLSRENRRLNPSTVYRIVTSAAARAGLHASPHYMRHAHASHSLDNGAPIHLVKQTLGHASIKTTEKYLHARPDESSGMYLE